MAGHRLVWLGAAGQGRARTTIRGWSGRNRGGETHRGVWLLPPEGPLRTVGWVYWREGDGGCSGWGVLLPGWGYAGVEEAPGGTGVG